MGTERGAEAPDNLEVRKAIVDRIKAGEITLEEGQREIRRIVHKARREGVRTYHQYFSQP